MRPLPTLATLFAAVLAVSGCVSEPAPRPVPPAVPLATPTPTPRPVVPTSADWRDWPVTPGDWVYRRDAQGSIALFGRPGSDALLTLRCDRERSMLYLSRAGAVAAPLVVRTTALVRSLVVRPTGAAPAYVAVAMTPADRLLDALAFSRGRFIIEQAGTAVLVVPAWAEVPRVIEDCRR